MSDKYFKISSALKNLIGSDLITDNFVAVFELVKNSFDANATEVKIIFENIYSDNAKIIIQDNGKGMNYEDLTNKWLFLAYSAKRDGTEDYRDKIKSGRIYAGAKGVGRFSCDRLGRYLNLITLSETPNSKIENIFVDWSKFESDQKTEFSSIPVEHKVLNKISYKIKKGTILEITGIAPDFWNRDNFKKLKEKLSKLIRPDLNKSSEVQRFKIILSVPDELHEDNAIIKKHKKENKTNIQQYYNTVNGEIKNFVFNELDIKTTKIESFIDDNGIITTRLTDRENYIYEIKENSEYPLLSKVGITLYFLNRSAKITFNKRTGVQHVDFGSIFVYKNGFRIYPYGERNDDSLGIDNRAMQGYARFIGLRSLMGEISIQGSNQELRETTSRGDGLIKNITYQELANKENGYFIKTLRRLEKYVIDVTEWGVNTDDETENLSNQKVKENLVKLIANISDDKSILSLTYNEDIISLIADKEEKSAKKLIKNFKRIAEDSDNPKLLKDAKRLERTLETAINAKNSAEKENEKNQESLKMIVDEKERIEKQNLFLKSVKAIDNDDVRDLLHIVGLKSDLITTEIKNLKRKIRSNKKITSIMLDDFIGKISLANNMIHTITNYSTKKNFLKATQDITTDLVEFISQYIEDIYLVVYKSLNIKTKNKVEYTMHFVPCEITMILDNMISNSTKAGAKNVIIEFQKIDSDLSIIYTDDGNGLSKSLSNPDIIFEEGITTTNGSGLGLSHVRKTLKKMNGDISLSDKQEDKGIEFIIRIRK